MNRQDREALAQHPDYKANLERRRSNAQRRLAAAKAEGNQVAVRKQTRIIRQLTAEIAA